MSNHMIAMDDTYFEHKIIDKQIVGAGILPVRCKDTDLHLLLGKERFINHWRGSLKWSGFEGGRKHRESVEAAAAREFVEESMAVVNLYDDDNTVEGIARHLENGDYFTRITLCILNNEIQQPSDRRYHVTYIVETIEDVVVEDFSHLRHLLVELQQRCLQLSRLESEINFDDTFLRENDEILAMTEVVMRNNSLRVRYMKNSGFHINEYTPTVETLDLSHNYVKWYNLRMQIHADISSLPHTQCVHIERNPLGFVTRATIIEDYIEKLSIHWWTLSELREVISNGGFTENDFFRAYFLPVLQRAVQELSLFEGAQSILFEEEESHGSRVCDCHEE